MKKRKWVYIQKPTTYEITCDKCEGSNIEWSEFEKMIWCYDCEIDTKGNGGIFNGPIPLQRLEILGLSLDRIYFKESPVMWKKPRIRGNRIIYWPFACILNVNPA